MSAAAIELRGVSRTHGSGDTLVTSLDSVDLRVMPGELVAVMGPSGSGKSTLLNLAGGLDTPTSGQVAVRGTDLAGLSAKQLAKLRRTTLGFVFQDLNLIPSLTAIENVCLPMELDGLSPRKARGIALEQLQDVGIGELADRFPEEMSGGQQQRAAIARALVGERDVILADEPTGALDSTTGEAVLAVLRKQCDRGAAGLLVTHEARHAAWADRVIFLRDGRVVDTTGSPQGADSLLVQVD
ncbi:ABC transporter ATP-binding protein [Yimella sp. cx-573]|nr:ABC transporter ATP-binding protein [Yimella sp. cx-573]